MHAILLLFSIIPLTRGYDLAVGLNNYGKKIFDESRQASPSIWRQKENVTIEAAEHEVITKVIVIDMRPEKDGDVKIVSGGEGQRSVTIELKSPTVFRGYDFHIFVYAAPEDQIDERLSASYVMDTSATEDHKLYTNAVSTESTVTTTVNPASMNSSGNTRSVRTADESNISVNNNTLINPPGSVAFGSANSYASTISNEDAASGSAMSVASVISSADSASGYVVSEASSNSSVGSTSGSVSDATSLSTEGLDQSPDGEATMKSTEVSQPGFNEYNIYEGTTNIPEENITADVTGAAVTTTVLPDMNIANGKDLTHLNGMTEDGSRHARKIEQENMTIYEDLSETTELTTTISENSKEAENVTIEEISTDRRHSRGITDTGTEFSSETTTEMMISDTSTEFMTTSTTDVTSGSDEDIEKTTDINIEKDMRRPRDTDVENSVIINETTTIFEEVTSVTESYSGDGEDSFDLTETNSTNYENIATSLDDGAQFSLMPDNRKEVIESNVNSINDDVSTETPQDMTPPIFIDQILRNSRDISKTGSVFGNNFSNNSTTDLGLNSVYPFFVDPSQTEGSEQNNSSDYVYIPVIALISKTSYPQFQEALQHLPGQSHISSSETKSEDNV